MTTPRVVAQVSRSEFEAAMAKASQVTKISSDDVYNRGGYDFYILTPEGRAYEVSTLVMNYSNSFSFHEAYSTIQIQFANPTMISGLLEPGNWVLIYGPYWNNSDPPGYVESLPIDISKITSVGKGLYQEIDRAQIVTVNTGVGDISSATVIAKTPEWLLAKNVLPYRVPKGTLKERLAFIAKVSGMSFDANIGEDSEYVLPATRGGRDTIWEDIQYDLGEVNRVEGKRFVLRQRRGMFYLHEITRQKRMWMFEVGANILDFQLQKSIEEYYNVVYVQSNTNSMINELFQDLELGEDANNPTTLKIDFTGFAQNEADFARFGQHILVIDEQHSPDLPTAQEQADYLLSKFNKIQQTATLQTFNLNGIRWGDQILIAEPTNNLYGVFWVRGGEQTVSAGQAIMDLDISFDYVAPESVRSAASQQFSKLWETLGVDPSTLTIDQFNEITTEVFGGGDE